MSKSNTYPIMDVLPVAIAYDEKNGFIKSGYGYYDHDNKKQVYDNKTAIRLIMEKSPDAPKLRITKKHKAAAEEMRSFFDNTVVMKKLLGDASGFDDTIGKIIGGNVVDNYGISILASLPNSFRIQQRRDELDEFFEAHRPISEYVGEVGKRMQFVVEVKDVKFIAKFGIHLVTSVSGTDIIKFFWSKDPDIADLIDGKTVTIVGTVKEQSVSKFSNCKETVVNRVKIK